MHHTGCPYCGASRAEHTAPEWAYCARQHQLLQQTAPGGAVSTRGPSGTHPSSTTEKEHHQP